MSKRAFALASLLTAAVAIPVAALAYVYRRPLPVIQGRLRLRGLGAPVEVIRDKWGVPHIYAQNEDDVFFAEGFCHAQDRLWQMEVNRRISYGRLAEIFGKVAYSTDELLRIVGLGRAAENDVGHASESGRRVLEAYARGVNAFIESNHGKLPLEFTLLRFNPEPWRPQDSMAWAKLQAWAQGVNWDGELLRAALGQKLGADRMADLHGDYPAENPLILIGQSFAQFAGRVSNELKQAQAWLGPRVAGGMSNNWVVDGTKSKTGKPLLANDPHMLIQMPSLWYEVHLVCPEFEAAGVSLPGAPGIIIGHNAEVAWGMTNAFVDCQDLYIERQNPDDPTLFEYRGEWERAAVVREEIHVQGESAPRILNVTLTRHGPLFNAWSPLMTAPGMPPVALRWVGYEPTRVLDAVSAMLRARTASEFRRALEDWTEPALSFVYADRAGNIGYQLAGRVPIRSQGSGVTLAPGWTGDYEWKGYVPFGELPHDENSEQHFYATANNRVEGAEYPHFLCVDTMNGFRAKRIVERLKEKEKLDADDFAEIQSDLYCAPAEKLVKLVQAFRAQVVDHPALRGRKLRAVQALDLLEAWDCTLTADSTAGALYQVMLYFAMRRVFQPWLGDLTDYFIGVGFHPLLHPVNSAYLDRAYLAALRILENEESEWLLDERGQACTAVDVLAGALADALVYLSDAFGDNLSQWKWGKLHRVAFKHPLGEQKPLDRVFNRGPYPYGGDTSTVWQAAFVPQLPIRDGVGFTAAWRQIMDLSDWDASRGIHTTGQSGHPASRHYDDMIPLWLNGAYHPLLWSREKIEQNKEGLLILDPNLG